MQQNSRVQIQNTEGPELKILITVLACAISTVHARRLIVLPFLRRSSNCDRHPTCFVLCQLSHQLLVSYREIHSCTPRLQPSSPPNKGVEQTLLSVMKNTYNSICIQTMTVKCTRKTLIQELKKRQQTDCHVCLMTVWSPPWMYPPEASWCYIETAPMWQTFLQRGSHNYSSNLTGDLKTRTTTTTKIIFCYI